MPTLPRLRRLLAPVGALLAVTALLAGCGSGSGTASGATSPDQGGIIGIQRPEPLDVSSVQVTDARTGEPVAVTPAEGELTLVYFGYTSCPDVCPTTLSDLRTALADVGPSADRVHLVFVTADPARDTAERLDAYVGSFVDDYSVVRIEDPAALKSVEAPFQADSSVGEPDAEGNYEVAHTAIVYAVGPDGKVLVEWTFGTSPDDIAHDLGLLLADPTT